MNTGECQNTGKHTEECEGKEKEKEKKMEHKHNGECCGGNKSAERATSGSQRSQEGEEEFEDEEADDIKE